MLPNISSLVASLGSKPQIITLTLDCLAQSGALPGSVIVIHTEANRPETAQALTSLRKDLSEYYPHIEFNPLELRSGSTALADVTAPDEVQAAFQIFYSEIRSLKLAGQLVHMQIAGGRRTLSVFGMAAAQMLFDGADCLWHLASHPGLELSGRLHAGSGEWVRLIPIPVITWSRLSPAFDILRRVEDPFSAADTLTGLRLKEQWDSARIFILTRISPAEKAVVGLLSREGLGQAEIAGRLSLSPRTVEQHLRSAYRKAAEYWNLEDVNQAQLVRLLAPFYISHPKE